MKHLSLAGFLFLFSQFNPRPVVAQNLGNLYPSAHYTLINTSEDALGIQDPITLLNAPFSGNNGVYSNGLYPGDHMDGCLVQTPLLSTLYDSIFAIQLEFNINILDGVTRAILVCGGSYRYLGFMIRYDSIYQILYNNSNYIDISSAFPDENVWHELTILHDKQTAATDFYLDGTWIAELNEPFMRPDSDGNIFNLHPGTGQTFLGFWRNLKVFGSELISEVSPIRSNQDKWRLFPNPSNSTLYIHPQELEFSEWVVVNAMGIPVLKGTQSDHGISISTLDPGIYFLSLLDQAHNPVSSNRFVKTN